jgi:hypothetical protein
MLSKANNLNLFKLMTLTGNFSESSSINGRSMCESSSEGDVCSPDQRMISLAQKVRSVSQRLSEDEIRYTVARRMALVVQSTMFLDSCQLIQMCPVPTVFIRRCL